MLLDQASRDLVSLAEEAIIADPGGEYRRRVGPDGVIHDYGTQGVIIAYRHPGPHSFQFIEFMLL